MARSSRAPLQFEIGSLLERLLGLGSVFHTDMSSLSSEETHSYHLRLSEAQRDLEASNLLSLLGADCYTNIVLSVREVLSTLESFDDFVVNRHNQVAYGAPTNSAGLPRSRGRPSFDISSDQLQFLIDTRFTVPQMAALLGVSASTISRRMYSNGMHIRDTYTILSDSELDEAVNLIVSQFPNIGYRGVSSHLTVMGIRVTERRIRESLSRVDPVASAYRRRRRIRRRQYSVPYPNALWHIDSNMSLIRWGCTVHGAIDGYSRLIVYLHCSANNRSETVLSLFVQAGQQYGFPSRTRSDCGGENVDVAHMMILLRGNARGSHITGRSIHNQRIERLWRDVFSDCLALFYHLFYYLENVGILCCDNDIHLLALQIVYIPRINQALRNFCEAWNVHPLRTCNNQSPTQLWVAGMLANHSSEHLPVREVFSQGMRMLFLIRRMMFHCLLLKVFT